MLWKPFSSQTRRFIKLITITIVVILVLSLSLPARGQLINLSQLKTAGERAGIEIRRVGNLEIAWARFDGKPLFPLAAPVDKNPSDGGDFKSIAWRIKEVEFKLKVFLKTFQRQGGTLSNLQVEPSLLNQEIVITLSDGIQSPIILTTVSRSDVLIDSDSPNKEVAAKNRAQIVHQALVTAWQQRQPAYRRSQILPCLLILLVTVALSLLWGYFQKLRSHWGKKINHHKSLLTLASQEIEPSDTDNRAVIPDEQTFDESSSRQKHSNLRSYFALMQREQVNLVLRAVLLAGQVFTWFVGLGLVLWRFPETRGLAQLIFDIPVHIVLIVLGAIIINGFLNALLLRLFKLWRTSMGELSSPSLNRLRLRIDSGYQELQNATTLLVSVVAILLFFIAIESVGIGLILLIILGFFGRQLITDWSHGAQILLDNQYTCGDFVSIGKTTGTVEFFNFRVTKIRTFAGALVTIPNSLIREVSNFTIDWSQIDFKIGVSYDTDLEKALTCLETVAKDLQTDPVWGNKIIQAPTVLGVDEFQDSSIILRILIRTKPGEQWALGREYRRRLKSAFDGADITIPFPQHSIWFENQLSDSHN